MVLAVLTWPYAPASLVVVGGLDSSWGSTLAMAAHNRMPFGTHIVFTYGPLGFLQVRQLNFVGTTVLGVLFALALSTAVFGALIWSLRRAVPTGAAVMVAYIVGAASLAIGIDTEFVLAVILTVCVGMLSRTDDEPTPLWIWVGLGGILSVFSLVKVSLAPGILAVLVVTIVSVPRGRGRATAGLAGGVFPTFVVCWFGTGNGLGNMVPFARGSAAIITGYASAQSLEIATRSYTYGLALLVVVLVGVFSWAHSRGLPRRSSIGIGIVTLVTVWMLIKEGFVRHDGHDLIFFAVAPLALAAFPPKRRPWLVVPGVLVLIGVLLIAADGVVPLLPRPDVAVRSLGSEASTLASSHRAAVIIGQSRRSLRTTYALPSRMVAMMRGQTVDISPWEQNVAWAYPQIRFDPLPVIQDYSAYTSSLDQLDTSYVASSDAPRFILRQPVSSDGRDPAFEPPDAQLAIECRYHQVAGDATWQLLERGRYRCGPLRSLGVATTGFGHWLQVPTAPAGDAIVARFQLSVGRLSSLEAVVFKPASVNIQYNGNRKNSWRFVTATGSDLHVLRGASTLGYYSGFTPPLLSSIRFSITGRYPTPSGVRVSFYLIHVASVAGGNGEVLPPLLTRMLRPANGAQLSGTAVLDARATDFVGVTKVQFYLERPSGQPVLIGTGDRTLYGWVALWNTTDAVDGTYSLHSVAYDALGRIAQSTSTAVTVMNTPSP